VKKIKFVVDRILIIPYYPDSPSCAKLRIVSGCKGKAMVSIEQGCVQFTFYRPGAQRIFVAGDFNGWKADDVLMVPGGDGNWKARVRLPAGEYRFRYCADGEWFADYAACGVEPGRFGMDSLVSIPPQSIKVDHSATVANEADEGIHVA
jgi:1,4-alpha-glucan branching enzyme